MNGMLDQLNAYLRYLGHVCIGGTCKVVRGNISLALSRSFLLSKK